MTTSTEAISSEHAPGWRLVPGQQLRCAGWDGEFLVYNDITGDTHLLTADAIALLLTMRDGACRVTDPGAVSMLTELQRLHLVTSDAC